LVKDKGNFSESSKFKFNEGFASNKAAFTLTPSERKSEKEDDSELKRREEDLVKERKIFIDASLVRIMKSRKTYDVNSLIADCTKHVQHQFRPEPRMIKL